MGKTRAEIQKAYRERKKAKDRDGYLKAERERQRRYYVPVANLSAKKRKDRNFQNKLRNQRSQAKKAALLRGLRIREQSDEEPISESGYASFPSSSRESEQKLVVNLPAVKFAARSNGAKRARVRALAKAHKSIRTLKNQKQRLERILKTKSKQLERLQKKIQRQERKSDLSLLTPRRRTDMEVRRLGLNRRSGGEVRRKLMMTNVLLSEIKESRKKSTLKKRTVLHRIVAGRVAQKYRCMKGISQMTGLSRRALGKCNSKALAAVSETRHCISRSLASNVEAFLSREDNCRAQPGKADVKKGKQTKVLTDYMRNLHEKFTAENPDLKISLATFCRLRPQNILLARFIARNACQCLRHQNMALKVQALRKLWMKISENPENLYLHKDGMKDNLEAVCAEREVIKYRTWKRVELENKTKKMMIIEEEICKETFIENILREIEEFTEHVYRLRAQYSQLKKNKENLKEHEMIVQMDFAENYSCRSLDEVQTAYWSLTSVILHPVVIYMKRGDELKHQSYVIISDTMAHSSSTVCTFIDAIIPELKKLDPELRKIHYWTDSPSSQYRNRFIFYALANHRKWYNCEAQWNYFEAGHGKSACDGLGGTVKRMADEASRQGNVLIQSARDFFSWAIGSSMKEVIFIFVDKQECDQKQVLMSKLKIKSLKNTMKIHAVAVDINDRKIMKTNVTSCYCDNCANGNMCQRWTEENVDYLADDQSSEMVIEIYFASKEQMQDANVRDYANKGVQEPPGQQPNLEELETDSDLRQGQTTEDTESVQKGNTEHLKLEQLNENCFVIARYDGIPYVGKVEEIDQHDGDCRISFMEKAKSFYRWPKREDVLWVKANDIICVIKDPQETGKSKRLYRLCQDDKTIFDNL